MVEIQVEYISMLTKLVFLTQVVSSIQLITLMQSNVSQLISAEIAHGLLQKSEILD